MGFDESASAVEDLLELVVGIRLRRVFSAEVERALEKRGLDVIERPSDHVDGRLARNTLLRLRITAGHLECLALNIARADRNSHRHALHFVLVEFRSRAMRLPGVEIGRASR